MPGPNKKPTALKILEGDAGKRGIPVNEPKPEKESRVPAPPAFLRGEAKKEWQRVAPELHRLGLLTKVDKAALTGYCIAWGDLVDVEHKLDKMQKRHRDYLKRKKKDPEDTDRPSSNGFVSITSKGNAIIEPLLSVRKQVLETMHKFLTEFGMSPASRTRIISGKGGGNKPPMSDMQRYMESKRAISN